MTTHSIILARKSCGLRSLVGYSSWGCNNVGHDWACTHTGTALRTLWILVMIMFCVSHVKISKHFIKNMNALSGSHCFSFRGLWSLVPDIWQPDAIKASSFIVLSLETIRSPFKKCLWSWTSLWGCKLFVCLQSRRIVFPLYFAFRCFAERAGDLHGCGHFLSWTQDTGKSPLAGSGHSMTSVSSLSTKSLKDDMTSDFLPYVRTLKGGGVKSGFP